MGHDFKFFFDGSPVFFEVCEISNPAPSDSLFMNIPLVKRLDSIILERLQIS